MDLFEMHCEETILELRERFSSSRCELVERMMSIMSNPIRFHILCALNHEPFTVSELVDLTDSQPSNVSQQLKMMTLAGYLDKERRGKQIYYRLIEDKVSRIISLLEELFPFDQPE